MICLRNHSGRPHGLGRTGYADENQTFGVFCMLFAIFLAVVLAVAALVCGATLQQLMLAALVLALACLGRGRDGR